MVWSLVRSYESMTLVVCINNSATSLYDWLIGTMEQGQVSLQGWGKLTVLLLVKIKLTLDPASMQTTVKWISFINLTCKKLFIFQTINCSILTVFCSLCNPYKVFKVSTTPFRLTRVLSAQDSHNACTTQFISCFYRDVSLGCLCLNWKKIELF